MNQEKNPFTFGQLVTSENVIIEKKSQNINLIYQIFFKVAGFFIVIFPFESIVGFPIPISNYLGFGRIGIGACC